MGASSCTNDRYKIIQENYGNQFKRYVIRENNKAFLTREVGKVKKSVGMAAQRYEKVYLAEIAEGEKQVKEYYLKTRKELNERQPGGIAALEQMTKKKVDDILGYSHIKQLFEEFKREAEQVIKDEEIQIIDELTSINLQYQGQYIEEHMNLALLNALPQLQKEAILKRGEMDLQNQILKTQQYIVQRYSEQLDLEYYEHRLNNIDCRTQLLKLVLLSKDKLLTALNLTLDEHIGTYILLR